MAGKCVVIYETHPRGPRAGEIYYPNTTDTVCRCTTHNWTGQFLSSKSGIMLCPIGELEMRIEFLEKKLGIDNPNMGT